jgi:hypothetical protein
MKSLFHACESKIRLALLQLSLGRRAMSIHTSTQCMHVCAAPPCVSPPEIFISHRIARRTNLLGEGRAGRNYTHIQTHLEYNSACALRGIKSFRKRESFEPRLLLPWPRSLLPPLLPVPCSSDPRKRARACTTFGWVIFFLSVISLAFVCVYPLLVHTVRIHAPRRQNKLFDTSGSDPLERKCTEDMLSN